MIINLKGMRAVVCGSSQGIGFGAAQQLAKAGASITLIARNRERLEEALSQLQKDETQNHDYLIADFSKIETLKMAINEFLVKKPEIHILVNNTGGPPPGLAIDAEEDEFTNGFSAHILCNHFLVKSLVPLMKKSHYGRIINVISTSVKAPIEGLGVSNTIRGAVASWAKTLSAELGPFGITVNNVLPGFINTGRLDSLIANRAEKANRSEDEQIKLMESTIPARRFGNIEEIGNAIVYLSSPQAAYINGTSLPVDGGKTNCL